MSESTTANGDEFPMLCETCLGSNPYVRMTKLPFGQKLCKISNLPYQTFRWKAGPNGRFKETIISFAVAHEKNICQCCLNDLRFGLPVGVRDAILANATNPEVNTDKKASGTSSFVGNQYHFQNALTNSSSNPLTNPYAVGTYGGSAESHEFQYNQSNALAIHQLNQFSTNLHAKQAASSAKLLADAQKIAFKAKQKALSAQKGDIKPGKKTASPWDNPGGSDEDDDDLEGPTNVMAPLPMSHNNTTSFRNLPKLCTFWLGGGCKRVEIKRCPYRPCCGVYLFPELASKHKELNKKLIEQCTLEGPAKLQKHLDKEIIDAFREALKGNKEDAIKKRVSGNDELSQKYVGQFKAMNASLPVSEDPNTTTLFLGNLDPVYQITENDIISAIYPYGQFLSVRVVPSSRCAFVEYVDRNNAEYALAQMFNKLIVKGCVVNVGWSKATQQSQHTGLLVGAPSLDVTSSSQYLPQPKKFKSNQAGADQATQLPKLKMEEAGLMPLPPGMEGKPISSYALGGLPLPQASFMFAVPPPPIPPNMSSIPPPKPPSGPPPVPTTQRSVDDSIPEGDIEGRKRKIDDSSDSTVENRANEIVSSES